MQDNQFFIDKYKDVDKIIATYYQARGKDGELMNVDGVVLPLKVDNRHRCSVPENQGDKPHCAGYSCGNMWESIYWKMTGRLINLESDQIYALAKQIDGNVDGYGTTLQAAQTACAKLCGFANDIKLGFLTNDGTENTIRQIKRLIHKYDFCHIGCNITDKWYSANSRNYVITPGGRSLGGHAIVAVGYRPDGLIIQNSWGVGWGAKSFAVLDWDAFRQQFLYACFIENLYNLRFS